MISRGGRIHRLRSICIAANWGLNRKSSSTFGISQAVKLVKETRKDFDMNIDEGWDKEQQTLMNHAESARFCIFVLDRMQKPVTKAFTEKDRRTAVVTEIGHLRGVVGADHEREWVPECLCSACMKVVWKR